MEKAFLILALTKVAKAQNIHGFMKGLIDDWLTKVHRLYSEGLISNVFLTELHMEYLAGSYKKGKQEAFFKLT